MITAIKSRVAAFDPVYFVRCLILAELLVMLFSTALTNFIEVFIFLSFLLSRELRSRVFSSLKQPMVIIALVFYGVISAGLIYGIGPWSEKAWIWAAWRKLLLIPLAAAVYDDVLWKHRMALAFIGVATAASLVSTGGYFLGKGVYANTPSIVVQNSATQGMVFAVAAFAAVVLMKFSSQVKNRSFWMLCACAAGLISNLVFITPGRSGYLALIVLCIVTTFYWVKGWVGYILILFVLPVVLGGLLMASPIAKGRILQAIDEIRTLEQAEQETSLGIRVMMWKNTVKLIHDSNHPLIGYGTGSFVEAYRRQAAILQIPGWQGAPVGDPHNQFMRITVEHGFIGLLIFLVFIGSFFKQKITGAARIMGIGVLLAWCATSMFSGHFSTFTEGRFLMIWCAAMLTAAALPPGKVISS